jgi:hypothetical protein
MWGLGATPWEGGEGLCNVWAPAWSLAGGEG